MNETPTEPKAEKKSRPKRIRVCFYDPFDDTFLGSSEWPYEPRKAADGWYSKAIIIMRQGLKEIQSHILQGRTPYSKTTLIR